MDLKTLSAEAILGKDAEDFLNSDLGQFLIQRAEEEAREWTEKLKSINPWLPGSARRVQRIQNEIWKREAFKQYLADLIINGRQALQLLEEEQ